MKKLFSFLLLFLLSFSSQSAPLTYKQYFEYPSKYGEYLKGFEQGLTLSQVMTEHRDLGEKLYCAPLNIDFSIKNLEIVIQSHVNKLLESGKRTQEEINNQPLGALLVIGLEDLFPCD